MCEPMVLIPSITKQKQTKPNGKPIMGHEAVGFLRAMFEGR